MTKSIRTTNRKCSEFVTALKPFTASNLCGKDYENAYVVWSYGWYPLFVYNKLSRSWYTNSDKYSVSTSKQYGQAHPSLDTYSFSSNHNELKILLSHLGVQS